MLFRSIDSRNRRYEPSNEMISFLQESPYRPITAVSRIDANTAPRHVNYLHSTPGQIHDSIYAQTLINDVSTPAKYLAGPSDQSALHHSVGATKACVTPTFQHHRRLCSPNDPSENILHDDSYEPLPLSNILEQYYDGLAVYAEEPGILNCRHSELFPLSDIYRPTAVDTNLVGSGNPTLHDAMQNQFNTLMTNDYNNNSMWNAVQLENLLSTLENDEWNRFA